MSKYIDKMVAFLDEQYKGYKSYQDKINDLKGMGYKVYRDSNGRHKIEQNTDFLKEVFGGVFKDI